MSRVEPLDFWRWAYSNFLSNTLRGVLAEYLVARAVGCTHRPRAEWDAHDLRTDDGLKIEVKSSAYLQAWSQQRPSDISFGIGLRRSWDAATNLCAPPASRPADVYVYLRVHGAGAGERRPPRPRAVVLSGLLDSPPERPLSSPEIRHSGGPGRTGAGPGVLRGSG